MNRLRTFLGAMACGITVLTGCSDAETDDADQGQADITRPDGVVPTNDTQLALLSGYNPLLDRDTATPCVAAKSDAAPSVGAVQSSFTAKLITSREELAQELNLSGSLSLRGAQAEGSGNASLMRKFKQDTTQTTFLIRTFAKYTVRNRAELALTPQGEALANAGNTGELLKRCGFAYAKEITYQADVTALLRFKTASTARAQQIAAELNGASPQVAKRVVDAQAHVQGSSSSTNDTDNTEVSVDVQSNGFLPTTHTTGDTAANMDRLDALSDEMIHSLNADREADVRDYFENRGRNATAVVVSLANYAGLQNAPSSDVFKHVTDTVNSAERFFEGVAAPRLRMDEYYSSEISAFFEDDDARWHYNVAPPGHARLTARAVEDVARASETAFRSDDERPGTLVAPLKELMDQCVSAAANGDYGRCATTSASTAAIRAAQNGIANYEQNNRVVRMTSWMPKLGATMSSHSSDNACNDVGMRLPTKDEIERIAPSIAQLAPQTGVFFDGIPGGCSRPWVTNDGARLSYGCETMVEAAPYVGDRMVICVAKTGAVAALRR